MNKFLTLIGLLTLNIICFGSEASRSESVPALAGHTLRRNASGTFTVDGRKTADPIPFYDIIKTIPELNASAEGVFRVGERVVGLPEFTAAATVLGLRSATKQNSKVKIDAALNQYSRLKFDSCTIS